MKEQIRKSLPTLDGGAPLAAVQYGELSEQRAPLHHPNELPVDVHVDSALWNESVRFLNPGKP